MRTDLKTVKEVCELTGLKRRQLYDYDKMGILKPSDRENEAGYKLYDEDSIRKLCQIALWREIGLSQKQIREIMTDPDCDVRALLETHIEMLENQKKQMDNMLVITRHLQTTQMDVLGIAAFSARSAAEIAEEIRAKAGVEMVTPAGKETTKS